MVLWIGVDDTDSLRGMCTTFLATEIVRDLTQDFDLIGYPRLVRLNPNIPWKTRGNGAICLRVGHGRGLATTVGEIGGRKIRSYPRGSKEVEASEVVGRIANLVERWSCFDDPTTNPAFVVLRRPPAAPLYWHAVRRVVTVAEARRAIHGLGMVRSYKEGRGIIGAAAATAWPMNARRLRPPAGPHGPPQLQRGKNRRCGSIMDVSPACAWMFCLERLAPTLKHFAPTASPGFTGIEG